MLFCLMCVVYCWAEIFLDWDTDLVAITSGQYGKIMNLKHKTSQTDKISQINIYKWNKMKTVWTI